MSPEPDSLPVPAHGAPSRLRSGQHCQRCGREGHNRLTCPMPPDGKWWCRKCKQRKPQCESTGSGLCDDCNNARLRARYKLIRAPKRCPHCGGVL